MSQAKIYAVKTARKAQGPCQKCGIQILPGMPYRFFVKGFRSKFKHIRCMKPECSPTRADRESSMLAEIYAAIDDASFMGMESLEEIKGVLEEVASVARDLAEQYATASVNQNTGAVFNVDAEERGQQLESYADDLDSWDPSEDEPEEPTEDNWDDQEFDTLEEAVDAWKEKHNEWLDQCIDEAREALDGGDF